MLHLFDWQFRRATRLVLIAAFLCIGLATGSSVTKADEQQLSAEEQEDAAIKAAVAAVAPSVLRVEAVGGAEVVDKSLAATGPTTGVVVDAEGYIVSSAFNFINQPTSILVTLPSGKRAAAEIVARDTSRMLVLLKVKTDETLPVPVAVPRGEMRVGQWAVAMGRTYDSPLPGLSVGVISALDRVWGKAIQTDAKISPSNYGGALIDIRGRVFGILAPLSPHAQGSEVAGAEWYDSGIGFAVPLVDIFAHLEKWKAGDDLQPGLMGISLKAGDIYVLPAEVVSCPVTSPAAKAGLKVGDVIVEAAGHSIARQAQLKHALGPLYAGEKVSLVAKRGEERVSIEIELTDKIEPYNMPFLGILPQRRSAAELKEQPGVVVRWVYPDSPAEKSGLKAGDRITQVGDQPIADTPAMLERLASWEVDQEEAITVDRAGETLNWKLSPTAQPSEVPGELPASFPQSKPLDQPDPAAGISEIRLPEAQNKCWAVAPDNYDPARSYGLVIWLPAPKEMDAEEVKARWQTLADEHGFVVIAPQPLDSTKWEATEIEFITKVAEEACKKFNIDRARIAVLGEGAGGAMAWLLATQQPELIRGLALVDPKLPRIAQLPDGNPAQRLFVWGALADGMNARAASALLQGLSKARFPVTQLELPEKANALSADQLQAFSRWVDTLDRM